MTITVCAYNRPCYLDRVLKALSDAIGVSGNPDHAIVVGIDPGGDRQAEVELVARHWITTADDVIVWPEHLGVSEHPRRLLQYVFTEIESDYNLHLEDDTVVSPDAINLCEWYEMRLNRGFHAHGEFALALHSGLQLTKDSLAAIDPGKIVKRADFGVWGWAASIERWESSIAPYWNHKRTAPTGWDWSMTATMERLGLYMLSPALSRVHNIGREGGAHQTPEGYDLEMKDQVWAGQGQRHITEVKDFHL